MSNHEVKGTLARLMATENLIVETKNVSTASFDVVSRILTLPNWEKANNVVYDLLVGHEVGHALYTPEADLRNCRDINPSFINVVEDVRIEKLMKRKFPGLRKTFYNGYQQFHENDFFELDGKSVDNMSLVDRINIHFKIGNFIDVKFSEDEKSIVKGVESVETFEDVVHWSKILWDYCQNARHQEKIKEGGEQPTNQDEESSSDSENPSPSIPDSTGGSSDPSTPSSDDSTPGDPGEGDLGDDDLPSMDGGGVDSGHPDIDSVLTQDNLDKALESLNSRHGLESSYVEVPKMNLDKIIVSNNECSNQIKLHFDTQEKLAPGCYEAVDMEYSKFKKSTQKEVSYLVKEFECKKSADSYRRTLTARTGSLDTTKLHTYKFNEDIFKKISVVPDGKNHGLIFVLDWSGSMGRVLHDTVCQLITLVWFCKRVGIPFDVYLFTNDWTQCRVQHDNYEPEHYDQVENAFHIPKYFSMVNILTSKVRSSELDSQIKNLYRISYYYGSSYGVSYQIPDQAGLSGTPLNEAVISLNQIIPEFQKKNGVQKVNCVILTDGEACSSKKCKTVTRRSRFDLNDAYTTMIHASIPGGSYIRDRQTGHTHSTEGLSYFGDITAACLRQLKTRFGNSNFIGIRLISGSSELSSFLNRHVEYPKSIECRKIWKKEKSFSIKTDTYDRCIAISTTTLRNDSTFYVNPDASKAQIKSAFKKSLNSKKLNKKVLTDFIEVIS
tara:strand:+ start:2988 stop:5159 length:2172 start_codon:yes stop_codon:yes gene_type:complete